MPALVVVDVLVAVEVAGGLVETAFFATVRTPFIPRVAWPGIVQR